MKKLKRLDISENDFGLPRKEVSDINFRIGYPSSDPNLENNWRSRNTNNALDTFDLASSETSNEEYNTLSIQKRRADEAVNNNACNTQTSQISQEDKDASKEEEEKEIPHDCEHKEPVDCEEEEERDDREEEEPDDHEEEEPDDHEEEDDCSETLSHPRDNNPPIAEECWDSEIIFENEKRANGIFRHPFPRYSNVNPHFFLPSDIHVPPVPRNTNWFYVEEGQFDDADDL